jgi:hypothetical protein
MRAQPSAAPGLSRDQLIPRAFHLCRCFAGSDRPVVGKKLVLCRGGLGERLLERAFAAGFAGDRQLRGPSGDTPGERCGALTPRDLDWCTVTDLREQPRAVLLR